MNFLEHFEDLTTKTLEIINFNDRLHNLILERVLKGCLRVKKLILNLSY